MVMAMMKKFVGTSNDRYVKKLQKHVNAINAKEAELQKLSDAELQARTPWLKKRLADGETLDDILVDAFATMREASKRVLGMRHFDVQLIGGIIIHRGMITEMKTGEGKTLVATLPVYLNALTGKGVHVVTVNDYLATRDSEWKGQIYKFLGLTVGCITNDISDEERRAAYAADVTYGTNNEFGFDYLRDNMKFHLDEMVQRPFNFAIVDEADSILIDEARTPLIISGSAEDSSELYIAVNKVIPQLGADHYEKDEKQRNVTLTDAGVEKVEEILDKVGLLKGGNLYDIQNVSLVMHVNQALKAHTLFSKDTDYIVKDGKIVIIDEFTGRMLDGRRYSEGLHQAIEAKEGVDIQQENQTLASVTFQNYFRLYPKLSGMTGSAMTEAAELADIYKLDVVDVPTNVPVIREDHEDEVYRTAKEKYDAILELIKDCQKRKQPALVGTTSIEKSEYISSLLKKQKISHNVLNARFHEQEAIIVAEAGRPGTITIATNMAGRGTDIKLGGNLEMRLKHEIDPKASDAEKKKQQAAIEKQIEEDSKIVREAGGLYVISTERHESRRIDNQLRGRAGRQGDPGASKFFLSLEDDLMRIFGSDRLDSMLVKLGLEDGEAITHPWVSKALEKAQQKVESRNYDIRKHLLKYDDVMNEQRKVIYDYRREIMTSEDSKDLVDDMREDVTFDVVRASIPENAYPEQWDVKGLHEEFLRVFGIAFPVEEWAKEEGIADEEIIDRVTTAVNKLMAEKEEQYGSEVMRSVERSVLLRILDQVWKEHLLALDNMRQGINLRAYAQRDPLNEYKQEAFTLFQMMLSQLKDLTISMMSRFEVSGDPEDALTEDSGDMHAEHASPNSALGDSVAPELDGPRSVRQGAGDMDPKNPNTWGRVKRNDPCPCGSGKKYKSCHGKI